MRLGADQPPVAPGSGPHKGHAVPQFATNSGHKASSTQLAAFVTNTARPNVGLPPRHPAGIVRAGGPIPGQACPGQAANMLPPGRAAATGPSSGSRRASSSPSRFSPRQASTDRSRRTNRLATAPACHGTGHQEHAIETVRGAGSARSAVCVRGHPRVCGAAAPARRGRVLPGGGLSPASGRSRGASGSRSRVGQLRPALPPIAIDRWLSRREPR